MESSLNESFLSMDVKQLVCDVGLEETCDNLKTLENCLQLPQGTIKWHYIQQELADYPTNYKGQVKHLGPICSSICSWIQRLSLHKFKETYSENLQWTGQKELFFDCFEMLQAQTICSTNISLLALTAALERALGDAYLTKNKPCPAMLKDLLVTSELKMLFGSTAICVLHILIGPPTSLNLRNVLWHGFAAPGEIPTMYAYFLLVVTASLGELLCSNLLISELPHRVWLDFPQVKHTKKVSEVLQDVGKDILKSIVNATQFIPTNMRLLWLRALEYYHSKRYGFCVMILLPQLELGIRRLFAKANNCPDRVLTAESSVLFTTFDEMLSSELPGEGCNALMTAVDKPYLEMLMDLLVHQGGPRLRSHLSHGEVNFFDVSMEMADFVVYVSLSWASLFVEKQCCDSELKLFLDVLDHSSKQYESLYHPKATLKQGLAELISSLDQWVDIDTPSHDIMEYDDNWIKQSDSVIAMTLEIAKEVCQNVSHTDELMRCVSPSHSLDDLRAFCRTLTLSTFSQTKFELEVTCLLQQILNQCVSVSNNILHVSSLRYEQLLKKELRSRQRKNYSKLLCSIPMISSAMRAVTLIICTQLYMSTALSDQDSQQKLSLIKFLKSVLQFTENMVTYSSINKNKWNEAASLIKSFLEKALSGKT